MNEPLIVIGWSTTLPMHVLRDSSKGFVVVFRKKIKWKPTLKFKEEMMMMMLTIPKLGTTYAMPYMTDF